MRDWQRDAPLMIADVHASMPDASPEQLRKALRAKSLTFSMGTSWGQKVWAKHCRIYLARMTGGQLKTTKPIKWPEDICFPFRAPQETDNAKRD